MIGNKKTISNIVKVSVSNVLKLLAGVLVGFLLPKIIGVTDYGYYKTFTLYASYAGLFHFGFADGIYLKFGGKNYDELNKEDFRYYTRFYILMEIVVSAIVMLIAVIFMKSEYRFIFICEAIYLLAMNVTNLYQLISQITNRFTELSLRNIINSGLTIISLILLWVFQKWNLCEANYRIYTVMYVLIIVVLTLWYIRTYQDITFGRKSKLRIEEMGLFFRLGFPLMLSALCSSLILTIDRQFVSALFDIDTYSVYAFAYSMLNLVTVAISAVSTVLYPTLKRADEKSLSSSYPVLIGLIQCLVCGCIAAYFPLCVFVKHFLPQYVESLSYFRIIFPGIALSSSISLVMHNYYKTLGWTVEFFKKCVFILLISAAANGIAYWQFKTPAAISVASIITLIIWYFVVQHDLIMKYKPKWVKNFIYIGCMMGLFYGITNIENMWIGFIFYIIAYCGITIVLYKNVIYNYVKQFIRNGK